MQRAVASVIVAVSAALAAGCTSGAGAPEALGLAAEADHEGEGFYADFAGCREVANVGNLPEASARPLVPPEFTLVGEGTGTAELVVRTVHCDAVSVDGGESRAGDVAQIGIVIVAPDGDGDINNYALYYDTSDERLAAHLNDAGVDARFVPTLEESLAVNADGSGEYHFAVRPPFGPRLTFDGPVGATASASIPFSANWWSTSCDGTTKMASTFPELFTAGNGVVLNVPPGSPLATLLGETTVSSWPVLQLFDHFPSAHMVVTIR
jgi:hypothetical protein